MKNPRWSGETGFSEDSDAKRVNNLKWSAKKAELVRPPESTRSRKDEEAATVVVVVAVAKVRERALGSFGGKI